MEAHNDSSSRMPRLTFLFRNLPWRARPHHSAAVLSLAGPRRLEIPDEGREIREMSDGDICGDGEKLQAERLDGPPHVITEDLSDPSFLGAGEHSGRYRTRMLVGTTA